MKQVQLRCRSVGRGALAVAAWAVTLVWAAPGRAECRPYVFGMGHYLATWANQPWSYDEQAMDRMVQMGATAVWIDFPWAAMEATEGAIDFTYADHQVDAAEARRQMAAVRKLPDMRRRVRELEHQLAQLRKRIEDGA